ncbi:galactokinase family protein [Bryobacter aggregatus]|uniref:GHMP family kinase ATP-binding protein n=1 Tax=Bryobacter aggregatus TaxID=360054 RepID=UPI0012BA83F5|nr:galactokinase family protein [Bryobacter aggregatus]
MGFRHSDSPGDRYLARAPGRLDLMGGNVDYTGGLVFQATIREATWATARLRQDRQIHFFNPQVEQLGWNPSPTFHLDDLASIESVRAAVHRDPGTRWTAYILGLFFLLAKRYPEQIVSGAEVQIRSEVPLNKGVSSSASLEVAVMKATAAAYSIALAGVELAEACQWTENVIAESACGVMDQMAVVLGEENAVLPILCQPALPRPPVRLPAGLACWGIDSGVARTVAGIAYETARAASFLGYKLICDRAGIPVSLEAHRPAPRWTDPYWHGYLSNLSPAEFHSRFEAHLPEQMTGAEYLATAHVHVDPYTRLDPRQSYRVRACTRYSVEDHARVQRFVTLAEQGIGAEQMGDLMYQSHAAYTECGLGHEATDLLVDLVQKAGEAAGLFGARVSGGGAGGTVVVLGRSDARAAIDRIAHQYAALRGYVPYVFEGSSMGADAFGVQRLAP